MGADDSQPIKDTSSKEGNKQIINDKDDGRPLVINFTDDSNRLNPSPKIA